MSSTNLANPQSLNLYVYVENDPVNLVDPEGLNESGCSAEFSYQQCGGDNQFWNSNGYFGNSYAYYQQTYGGMTESAAAGLRLHLERISNSQAGYGFRTHSEVAGAMQQAFSIFYLIFDDRSIWTHFRIDVGPISPPWHQRGALGQLGDGLHGFANGLTGGLPDLIDDWMGRENGADRSSSAYRWGEGGGTALGVVLPGPGKLKAAKVIFGHGARHLIGTGLSRRAVESAIRTHARGAAAAASQTGEFWGRVTVAGKTVEYRAFTLPNGTVNVGTYYIP